MICFDVTYQMLLTPAVFVCLDIEDRCSDGNIELIGDLSCCCAVLVVVVESLRQPADGQITVFLEPIFPPDICF